MRFKKIKASDFEIYKPAHNVIFHKYFCKSTGNKYVLMEQKDFCSTRKKTFSCDVRTSTGCCLLSKNGFERKADVLKYINDFFSLPSEVQRKKFTYLDLLAVHNMGKKNLPLSMRQNILCAVQK